MFKENSLRRPLPSVSEGFMRGLAQMAALGRVRPRSVLMAKSAAEALHGDWIRLGGDMSRAIEKARASGEKATPK
jgi:hypothetical protein